MASVFISGEWRVHSYIEFCPKCDFDTRAQGGYHFEGEILAAEQHDCAGHLAFWNYPSEVYAIMGSPESYAPQALSRFVVFKGSSDVM